MKKTYLAAAAMMVLAGAAQAQSSVTLYGVADTNIGQSKYTNGTNSGLKFEPISPKSGPRFGFRGSEDLGGGMSANFNLEAGYSLVDGTTTANSQLFNRNAWAGVKGNGGELRMGRQESLTRLSNLGYTDITAEGEMNVGDTGMTGTGNRPLMYNFGSRYNNVVRYISPVMSGFKVTASTALGQKTQSSVNALQATYDQGPLKVALTHEYFDGSGWNNLGAYNQSTMLGGQYNLGFMTVLVAGQQIERFLPNISAANNAALLGKHAATNIGVMVPFGKWEFRVQSTQGKTTSLAGVGLSQGKTGVSARYILSPRTMFYAFYVERTGDAIAASATAKKSDLGVGITHTF